MEVKSFTGFTLRGINMSLPCIVALDVFDRLPIDYNDYLPRVKRNRYYDMLTKEFYRRGTAIGIDKKSFKVGSLTYVESKQEDVKFLSGFDEEQKLISLYREGRKKAVFFEKVEQTDTIKVKLYSKNFNPFIGTDWILSAELKIDGVSLESLFIVTTDELIKKSSSCSIITNIIKDELDEYVGSTTDVSDKYLSELGIKSYTSVKNIYMGGLLTSLVTGNKSICYCSRVDGEGKLSVVRSLTKIEIT